MIKVEIFDDGPEELCENAKPKPTENANASENFVFEEPPPPSLSAKEESGAPAATQRSAIARPGISQDMLYKAGVRDVEQDEANSLIGYASAGLVIPYRNLNNSPLVVNGKPFCRLRLRNPKSDAKYLSPRACGSQLYLPSGLRALLSPSCVLGVVEGEFKAMALVEAGFACVGIGGISSACPRNDADEPELLPALTQLLVEVRPAKIAFIGDNDTALIPAFPREAVKLAKLAGVPIVLPRIALDAPGKGPDDLREKWGAEFPVRWQAILATAEVITAETNEPALAIRLLQREQESFGHLPPDARDAALARLVKFGVAYRNDTLAYCEIVLFAKSAAGISMGAFRSAVSKESKLHSAAASHARLEVKLREYENRPVDSRIFFDGSDYWRKEKGGAYGRLCREDVRLQIGIDGFNMRRWDGEPSPADRTLHHIQVMNRVDYAGPVCGRPAGLHIENGHRILVTRSPTFIGPKAGDCPTINRFLANLYGHAAGDKLAPTQAAIFIGWLKLARMAVRRFLEHLPGQVLALVGPPDCGKSLLQSYIITPALGGRVAEPTLWMSGGTTFNSDLWGAEHLAIGDESLGDDGRERARLRDELKCVAASPEYFLHRKHKEALTLRPIWRISISANDDPESAASLPALDAGFADKIIYLQCYLPPEPFFDENDPAGRENFVASLRNELPAFLAEVDSFAIPAELTKSRFGIREFHHPAILDLLQSSSPLMPVAEAIESWIDAWEPGTIQKALTSVELYAALDNHLDHRLRTISSGPKHLGHQLARLGLLDGWRGRVNRKDRRIGGRKKNQRQTVWEIRQEASA